MDFGPVGNYLPLTGGTLTGNLTLPDAGVLMFGARSQIQSSADGNILLENNAGTGFTRLQLGGTTSSFPAVSRAGAEISLQLADASGWANLRAGLLQSKPDAALVAGGDAGAGLAISTSSIRVIAGSGVPTVSAAQGTLYLRSDGSSTSTRLYVNTNGTTGWTNVTTAA